MGRDAVLSRQPSCNVLGRDSQIIAFDCDVTFGSSGAPVFQSDGMTTRIVSIISAGHNENGERFAFGPILESRVAALTATLRGGGGLWASATAEPRRLRAGTEREAGGARFLKP
jgi:protease YdgD